LTEWGANESESKQIIDYLKEEDFLNEQRFTQAFVKDKFRFAKWGKIKISFELRMKHIPESEISQAMLMIDEDEYENVLYELIEKKDKSIKYASKNDRKAKLLRFAQSRGFEINLALKVIDK
ncbi:MAG: RecX family transcriptional regulator, partial [Paludibacteraceae bacterium]|nr:RecX family transcriptional regulator [Paludibacteraceae bacterium]